MTLILGLLIGLAIGVGSGVRPTQRHDATQRRIGWGYGYGTGWVDHKFGIYAPRAPADGRARPHGDPGSAS